MSGKTFNKICPLCQQVVCECDFHSKEYADKLKKLTFEEQEDYLRDLRNDAYSNENPDNKNSDRESGTYNVNFGSSGPGYWKR